MKKENARLEKAIALKHETMKNTSERLREQREAHAELVEWARKLSPKSVAFEDMPQLLQILKKLYFNQRQEKSVSQFMNGVNGMLEG